MEESGGDPGGSQYSVSSAVQGFDPGFVGSQPALDHLQLWS